MVFLFSLQYIKITKVQQRKALYPNEKIQIHGKIFGEEISIWEQKGSLVPWTQKHLLPIQFSSSHCSTDSS